jgi:hypothetical protein
MPSWTQLEDRHPLSGIVNEALKCPSTKPKRVLEPVERISEFLFGLIMVLTLTCSFNVGEANRGSARSMLLEALDCNVAWAIIDAFFFLFNCPGQRGQRIVLLKQLHRTFDQEDARRLVAEALPPLVASSFSHKRSSR